MAYTKKNCSKAHARSLAIAYSEFNKAMHNNDLEGQRVWARFLIDSQNEAGIEIHDTSILEIYTRIS